MPGLAKSQVPQEFNHYARMLRKTSESRGKQRDRSNKQQTKSNDNLAQQPPPQATYM